MCLHATQTSGEFGPMQSATELLEDAERRVERSKKLSGHLQQLRELDSVQAAPSSTSTKYPKAFQLVKLLSSGVCDTSVDLVGGEQP